MGSIGKRVLLAILVTALVPLGAAIWLANASIENVSNIAFQPQFGQQLERSLGVYADLVSALKRAMRAEGALLAADPALRRAAAGDDATAASARLRHALKQNPKILSLSVMGDDDEPLATVERERGLSEGERAFTVTSPLDDDGGRQLVTVFAADSSRLGEMEAAQEFTQGWRAFAEASRGEVVEAPHLRAFMILLGVTALFATVIGVLVARPVIRRINDLARATRPVAKGDLTVRVAVSGKDEVAALGRAFNDMLERLDQSRARIEFLRRVGEWQQMARRLAHEIKNPLTPIQLAVSECKGRYAGDDEGFADLLATTDDIVTEEIASLRRLVGEFSAFARMPRATLQEGDLRDFLSDQLPRLEREEDVLAELDVAVPDEEIPIALDRTMLYRVLTNLVVNASQAATDHATDPRVVVRAARRGDAAEITIEDNGPGVPEDKRAAIFDPYVTSKKSGTGLGLTIVRKVVIDHGGEVEVDAAPLGGARFRIRLPLLGTAESDAALAQSDTAPVSATA